MQSAFVEIGLERAAFLHIADIWEHRQNGHGGADSRPIEKILHEGQPLLVQVIKDPIGTKGARLSTQVSLAGRLLVYLPQDSHIGISQRIEDEAEREILREKLQLLLPEGMTGGFIIRTMAETATEREMKNDIDYLTKLWRDLNDGAREKPAPALLYQDLSLAQRVLRDMATEETERIVVDSRETFVKMQEFAREYTPALVDRIHHHAGERPLFDLYSVEDEIEKALARRVDLKSGGYLIVDQTEAMTTIDVNTGGFVGGRSFDDTIFKTNLEAAQVIARQLRLRNLGGIIIIDFIDMENADHRDAVLAELNRALERDRTRLTVNGFTQLGLVEMTRKRTRESLAHVLCEPCPTCHGPRRAEDRADDLLRDPARDPARGEAVQRARVPHPRRAAGDRPLPRRGIAVARAAGRLHRQADLAAGRVDLHAGAVRHRADLTGTTSRASAEPRHRASRSRAVSLGCSRARASDPRKVSAAAAGARSLESVANASRLARQRPGSGQRASTSSTSRGLVMVAARAAPRVLSRLQADPRGIRARHARRRTRRPRWLARPDAAAEESGERVALLELVRRRHRRRGAARPRSSPR